MKKRDVIILIILLAIGFASVSTTLVLNGIVGIGSNEDDFDVIFTEALLNGEEDEKAVISENKKSITFTTDRLRELNESARLDYKVKNTSTQYGANVTISCNNYGNEYIEITGEFDGNSIPLNEPVEIEAQEVKNGYINAELVKVYGGEDTSIDITCTIVANATEKDNVIENTTKPTTTTQPTQKYSWEITEDNDNNGEVSKDDLITIGTESFYVYNTEGNTIKAISQYNLEVGNSSNSAYPADEETNIQSPRAIGYKSGIISYSTVAYATDDKHGEPMNSYTGSILEEYVNKYVDILKERYDVKVTGRLITKEELEALGCDSSTMKCSSQPAYITSTTYWTMTPSAGYDNIAWDIDSNGIFSGSLINSKDGCGVRPVIEIQKSLFE